MVLGYIITNLLDHRYLQELQASSFDPRILIRHTLLDDDHSGLSLREILDPDLELGNLEICLLSHFGVFIRQPLLKNLTDHFQVLGLFPNINIFVV